MRNVRLTASEIRLLRFLMVLSPKTDIERKEMDRPKVRATLSKKLLKAAITPKQFKKWERRNG